MKRLIPILVLFGAALTGRTLTAADNPALTSNVAAGREARMYLRHARDWAAALYDKAENKSLKSPREAQDLIAGIARDLKRSQEVLLAIVKEHGNEDGVDPRVDRIHRHENIVQELNGRLSDVCARQPVDFAAISEESSKAWHELNTTEIEVVGLLRTLKLDGRDSRLVRTYERGNPDSVPPLLDSISHEVGQVSIPSDKSVSEHVAELELQVAQLKKEYSSLSEAYRKEQQLSSKMKSFEDRQAQLEEGIGRLKKSSQSRPLNPVELRQAANIISRLTHEQLFQMLNANGPQQPVQQEILKDRPYSN